MKISTIEKYLNEYIKYKSNGFDSLRWFETDGELVKFEYGYDGHGSTTIIETMSLFELIDWIISLRYVEEIIDI